MSSTIIYIYINVYLYIYNIIGFNSDNNDDNDNNHDNNNNTSSNNITHTKDGASNYCFLDVYTNRECHHDVACFAIPR